MRLWSEVAYRTFWWGAYRVSVFLVQLIFGFMELRQKECIFGPTDILFYGTKKKGVYFGPSDIWFMELRKISSQVIF